MDALFCAEFVRCLIRWQVPNYNHILFVKRVLVVLMAFLRGATTTEAQNISLFMLELFTDLSQWSESEQKYNEVCLNNPVFIKNTSGDVSFESFCKVEVIIFA